MRIVFISDTHGMHAFRVPDGDLLVHCGDFTMKGFGPEIIRFNAWLASLPHEHKIVIAGNHELSFERSPETARSLLTAPIYLQDSAVVIDGVKIYGSPWQPFFYDWAFNLRRGSALAEKWSLIPDDTDVLVTHGPPHGVLDLNLSNEHCGCEDLKAAVDRIKPAIHAFGHIHLSHGTERLAETLYVNACICTERYDPWQSPVVVDLVDGFATVVEVDE